MAKRTAVAEKAARKRLLVNTNETSQKKRMRRSEVDKLFAAAAGLMTLDERAANVSN